MRKRQETRFVNNVLGRLDEDLVAGRLTGPADLEARATDAFQKSLTRAIARRPYRFPRLMARTTDRIVSASVELIAELAATGRRERLQADTRDREDFEARLRSRWGGAIDALVVFRSWCMEAGMVVHDRRRPAEGDWVYPALVRLHARMCLIAAEVLALLRAGLASGAHARWRSAHEVAVVAFFLEEHDQDTAERYVLHEAVESYRAAVDYQTYANRLGLEPFTLAELGELEAAKDALCVRFGPGYGSDYGWAAKALGRTRPTFREIEAATRLDHLRPYYRMASHPTHAGSKGLSYNIGLMGSDLLLAGPSNAGLADPGQSMAISLLQVTVALLKNETNMGDVATMVFLSHACRFVENLFIQSHSELEEDERDVH
jgi:uncharacterized protein DUF5677